MSGPHRPVGEPRLVEVGAGRYAYVQPDGTWWINNAGALVSSRGVVSIDALATERRTRAYLTELRAVTTRPVRTLINTHHHGDHTFGNYLFEGATIVAHEQARAEARAWGQPRSAPFWTDVEWGDIEIELPFLTYSDGVTLWVDDVECQVRHVGQAAHTTNDSIVWIPDERLLYCGDLLMNGGSPFVVQGSVAGAIDVLEQTIRPLGATTIVPGHGPVAGPDLIDRVLAYLRFVEQVAREAVAADLTPLQAALETDLGDFAALTDPERIVGNLHRSMAELTGTPRGGRIDARAVLADMVVYNGGQPLRCMA